MRLIRRLYGGHPVHLLAMLASFAIAGAALLQLRQAGPIPALALWLGGAIVLHDFVLYPVYAMADRALSVGTSRPRRAPLTNYVRVPTMLSALLLAISFPLVLRLADGYEKTAGLPIEPFLGRWLAISGALFAGSAVLYAMRAARRRPL